MTQALAHASITRSRLTRFLIENALIDAPQVHQDIGPRLGEWLNFRQAIALHGVLQPDRPADARPAPLRRSEATSAQAWMRRVQTLRDQLEQAITQGAPVGTGLARIDLPPLASGEPGQARTAYEPYRRFHAAHQRQMDTVVRKLRAQLRAQLSQKSPALQQLALLDAAFENILHEREALLLSHVAQRLEQRFVLALKHQPTPPIEGIDAGASRATPPRWITDFRQTLRSALLAELDTRWQPVLGLLEAFQSDTPPEP